RPDQGLRGHPGDRPDREHVHGGAVHPDGVRLHAGPRQGRAAQHLSENERRIPMFQMLVGTNLPFMKAWHIAYFFSGSLILATAVWLLIHHGPRYSVDFT